ncbi:hypothetical protein [Nodularia sp. NIES-3585]|uniref:hypothetical protein n=1 Tax=Nodularia sp. NIES-3585 TaxID=1973477 RepID=UPI000B69CC8A|nr:hypothetical protein [Nodularia sp. NIES-3585]GAX38942.1 hypothetical protein NIES3585_49940 [Nodularia sp. NIES-3585]
MEELLKNTPDLYRIDWKVCGIESLNLHKKVNQGCDETKEPPTTGFSEPMYLWGPATDIQIKEKISFVKTLTSAHVFVKSRGCLSNGNPQEEQFFKVRSFLVKNNNVPKTTDFQVRKLSDIEKQLWVSYQVGVTAEERRLGVENIRKVDLNASKCQTLEAWERQNL